MKFKLVESLNDFKKVKIPALSIDKYKHLAPFLKHVRDNGKGYIILDGDNVVGVINTEDKNGDVWIQGIEISKQYQNKGIGKELLDYAVKNLGVTHLSVSKKNMLAYNMYLKYGFEVYYETDNMYFMRLKSSKNESILSESDYESHIEMDHKLKGNIDLSSLLLKVRLRNDKGKSKVYSWYKDDDFVGTILIDTIPASDGYKWFGSLRVSKKYRGFGIGDLIIEFAKLKGAGALAVNKDNEIAIHLYEKHGFKISKDRVDKDFYFMYFSRQIK